MPRPVGYSTARIVLTFTPSGREYGFSIGVKNTSSDDPNITAEEISDSLKGVVSGMSVGPADPVRTLISWTWSRVDVSSTESGGVFDGSHAIGVVGTNTIIGVPVNTSLLIRKRTALGNKHGRGRMYEPVVYPQATLIVAGGSLSSDDHTILQTGWDNFFANFTLSAGANRLCIIGTGSGAPTPPIITSLEVETRLATQRKRLR